MNVFGWMAAISLGSVGAVLIFELWPRDWLEAFWRDAGSAWWGK